MSLTRFSVEKKLAQLLAWAAEWHECGGAAGLAALPASRAARRRLADTLAAVA